MVQIVPASSVTAIKRKISLVVYQADLRVIELIDRDYSKRGVFRVDGNRLVVLAETAVERIVSRVSVVDKVVHNTAEKRVGKTKSASARTSEASARRVVGTGRVGLASPSGTTTTGAANSARTGT